MGVCLQNAVSNVNVRKKELNGLAVSASIGKFRFHYLGIAEVSSTRYGTIFLAQPRLRKLYRMRLVVKHRANKSSPIGVVVVDDQSLASPVASGSVGVVLISCRSLTVGVESVLSPIL